MPRFPSLTYAPAETRRLLRERLGRFLSAERQPRAPDERAKLDDELFLELMLGLEILFDADVGAARAIFDASAAGADGHPTFNSLVTDGAIRVRWGRVALLPPYRRSATARTPPAGMAALNARWHKQTFRLPSDVHARTELSAPAAEIEQAAGRIPVACQTPSWVAARMWDRSPLMTTDAKAGLRQWLDRWVAMDAPLIVPSRVWGADQAKAFIDTALDVLDKDAEFPGWSERREQIISEIMFADGLARDDAERHVPPLPSTAVRRAAWLDSHGIEQQLMEALIAAGGLYGLMRVILTEGEETELSPAPNPLAVKILALTLNRLDLFHMFLHWIKRHPRFLADMLLFPPTVALACMLIARWDPPHDAWNRTLMLRDHQTSKATAFLDAVSVLGHHLTQGAVPAEEAAALLESLHADTMGRTAEGAADSSAMIATLKGELARQSADTLRTMVMALAPLLPGAGIQAPAYAAALDIIEVGGLAGSVDGAVFVDEYLRSVAEGEYALTAHRISEGAVATLFELVSGQSPARRNAFLFPLCIEGRVKAAAGQNPYTAADAIARSLRCHIRVLSRMIAGLADNQPDDLIDALVAAVRPVPNKIEGQVTITAFSPRYETGFGFAERDRFIAADIGAALKALSVAKADRVLNALLESSEPLILADMLGCAPRTCHKRLEKRLEEISPVNAGGILSLHEAQARIDRLLLAGMTGTAAKFIEDERNLKTFGNAPGRSLAQLRAELRFAFAKKDWATITNAQLPGDLTGLEEDAARDAIAFFRALAELKKPSGDVVNAEATFARLESRHATVAAYAINRLAARISQLLGGDGFVILRGQPLAEARTLLMETEPLAEQSQGRADGDIVAINRTLLLLAAGQPDAALQTLALVQGDDHRATIAAYTAVAQSRMGRVEEAASTLRAAEAEFGTDDVVKATRDYLAKGAPFANYASASLDDDPVPRVHSALLAFLQLDPVEQARALSPNQSPFDDLVIGYVRSASGAITGLLPMMKHVTINESEDDLTAVLQRVLEGHVTFLGWTLADQSRGGRTPKANAGERDLVIRKGSTTLAVLEAVVCDRPVTQEWSRKELTMHFQKLFGYDTCRLFFHLTYAYVDDLAAITTHLKQSAQSEAPNGFAFLGVEDIVLTDSRPTGFVARYQGSLAEIKVVFLILDLGQQAQRGAMALAARTNPRNKKAVS